MPGRSEEILALYAGRLQEKLSFAMEVLGDQIQESIATLYPPSSAPGDPPHRRSGRLYHGIVVHHAELHGRELIGSVGTTAPYSIYLESEFGTSKMKPRPFMRPGLHNNAENIRRILAES